VALKNDDMKNVKHDKLLPFKNWYAMLEEAKYDAELGRIAKIVKDGNADHWIEVLENHKNSPDAHVTFTTSHRSKGREFSQVIVEDDFKSAFNEDGEFVGLREEEQNLLYVACTRAINRLEYNQTVAEYMQHMRSEERDEELLAA
jgi:superfamily I DNA/RNA helicase